MLNLNDLTKVYIETYIGHLHSPSVYTSFKLMQDFSLMYAEDKYVDLISANLEGDMDCLRDDFLFTLKKDMYNIAFEHKLVLDSEMDLTLVELNSICSGLFALQSLENYESIVSICSTDETPKEKLIAIFEKLVDISNIRLREIISEVSQELIEAIRKLSEDSLEQEPATDIDHERKTYIDAFKLFVGKEECMALELYEKGYTDLTLRELEKLLPMYYVDLVNPMRQTSVVRLAFEVYGFLILTKDDYNNPIKKFAEHGDSFLYDSIERVKLNGLITNMHNDFLIFLNDYKQKKAATNGN